MLPAPLARLEQSLLMFASFGGPTDTLRALELAAERMISALPAGESRSALRMQLFARAASLSFSDYRFAWHAQIADRSNPLLAAQSAYARGDSLGVRRFLETIHRARERFASAELSLEAVYPEAWLLAAIGDHRAAVNWLDPTLSALRSSGSIMTPVSAASLVRAMAFRAETAARLGDSAGAAEWARAVLVMWDSGDAFLQPLVARMRKYLR